jgi:NAD(P)-dependent dehydrogenase (short-subunit alcohol dehydrogenase family)
VFRSCQEFGRWFVTRAQATGVGASIINIGSASGLTPLSRVFTYSMTKAAIHNLTKNLAREWGSLGIRVNVLVPGFFVAEQNRSILSPDRITSILGHTPMGRFGEPEDLAGAALLLASDAGRFITGTELVVDGGFHSMTI